MKNNTRDFWVGLFAGLGFLILTVSIFFVGGISVFRHGYMITLKFDYVSILDKGAPVRMAGVRVGEVKAVVLKFDAEKQKNRVFVSVFLDRGTEIHSNYVFSVQGTMVLSEPHIEITPQIGHEPILKQGAVIEGVGPFQIDDLIGRSQHIAEQLDMILGKVKTMTDDQQVLDSLKIMVINFAQLSEKMNKMMNGSQEDIEKSIQDLHGFAETLNRSANKLDSLLNKMDQGQGTVGKLVSSEELYNEMKAFMTDIRMHPWKLLKKDSKEKKFLFF